jgi:hypothetical protein
VNLVNWGAHDCHWRFIMVVAGASLVFVAVATFICIMMMPALARIVHVAALAAFMRVFRALMVMLNRLSGKCRGQNGCGHHDGQCDRKKFQAYFSFKDFRHFPTLLFLGAGIPTDGCVVAVMGIDYVG